MDIIVDTREQRPVFDGQKYIRFKLLVGDYSTVQLRDKFCIERKSLPDLYGTILKGHVRFRNELIRAKVNGITLALYIEGTKKQFINKDFPGGSLRATKGETLGKIISTIERKYGIEVVWCKSRTDCKNKILSRLKLEQQNENKRTTKRGKNEPGVKPSKQR